MRCFIGLALPPEAREALAAAIAPLRSAHRDLSWTAADNYHLTLAFLGELEGGDIDEAAAALGSAGGFGEIPFSFDGLGTFPKRGAPRVLYARLADAGGSARLCRLVRAGLGQPAVGEAAFLPHVTLARARSRGGQGLKALSPPVLPAGSWNLGRCSLYKSLLLRSGPVYTELFGVDMAPR